MTTKMTHAMRTELANALRGRYATAAHKDKRRILEEFVAATGYQEKSAIRVLNSSPEPKRRQTRQRPSLYDEAARGALIVLWEASDRVCGKRLKALLPILLPALERNGHLKLEIEIRCKILSMSAATIDRLLQMPRRTTLTKKPPRVVPEPRRRIKMRQVGTKKRRRSSRTKKPTRGSVSSCRQGSTTPDVAGHYGSLTSSRR